MNKSIAVVGCGHWGKNLVRNFATLDALGFVCDPNVDLANEFAERYSVPSLSFEDVMQSKSIEAVVLAVPAPLHASMALRAIEKGKHVYVEKPLAINREEAIQMINSAKSSGVHLMVGHLLQYHPVFEELKKMVEGEKLGDLKYIYSNRLSLGKVRSVEDVIWSFAPHDISMILALAGCSPTKVRAESAAILQQGIADIATLHLEFESGLRGRISVSWLNPEKEQKLVVIGENGMAVFDDTECWEKKLSFYRYEVDLAVGNPSIQSEKVKYVVIPRAEPLLQECKYFLDLIAGIVPPKTDGEEGLRVLDVLAASTLSQVDRNAVRL